MTTARANSCATRYPLLLLHGVGVRDGRREGIWGRIPQALRDRGAEVFFGGHDGWGTPVSNAVQLQGRLAALLAETGAGKVNVLAHSKGGLDARHLIALLAEGAGPLPVASLTTVATPHHGSRTLDKLLASFRPVFVPLAFVVNGIYRALGDACPDFLHTCEQLSASHMQAWNAAHPLPPSVYSRQYGSTLHRVRDSLVSVATYPLIRRIEGPNDGLVTLSSAAFGNFCGELATSDGRGIAHARLVDIPRGPLVRRRRAGRTAEQGAGHPAKAAECTAGHQTATAAECIVGHQTIAAGQGAGQGAGQTAAQASRQTSAQASARASAQASAQVPAIPLAVDDMVDFYLALVAHLKAQGY